MSANKASQEWEQTLLDLASRPCGTNAAELSRLRGLARTESSTLRRRAAAGKLIRIENKEYKECTVYSQYFRYKKHAKAWEKLPPMQRPNVSMRERKIVAKSLGPIQSKTWNRTPLVGAPAVPPVPRQQGISLGYDQRFQCSPSEVSSLNVSGFYSSGAYRNDPSFKR